MAGLDRVAEEKEFAGPPQTNPGPQAASSGLAGPPSPTQKVVDGVAPEAAKDSGLKRFAKNLGLAGISLASGIPAIQLKQMQADRASTEAETAAFDQETTASLVAAESAARVQELQRLAFDPAGGANADAALNQLMAENPEIGMEAFEAIGAVDHGKREEASREASDLLSTPFPERRQKLLSRATRLGAEGRDATETIELMNMPEEDQNRELRILKAASLTENERGTAARGERQVAVAEEGLQVRRDQVQATTSLAEATRLTADAKANLATETGLRKEVNSLLGDYFDVADATARVRAAGNDPSGAGDLALIFNFMKILDPGSSVREGEFANAENSGGVDDKVWGLYNNIVRGERLSPPMRADFLGQAEALFEAQTAEAQNTANAYERIATSSGVRVDNVLATFHERSGQSPAAAGGAGTVTQADLDNMTPEDRALFE